MWNVIIGGVSIGMTPKFKEALEWLHGSQYGGKKELIRMGQ